MDNIIYYYLINNYNNNNNNNKNESEEFLYCLLILSINNLNITFNQLQEYCNNINDKNNIGNIQKKRKISIQEEEKEQNYLNDLKGLNYQQFQIINNHLHINILGNKRIAFDCSIQIIIKNNLNHQIINNNNQLILKSLPLDQINKELNQYIDYNYILFKKFDQALTCNIIGNTLKTINFGSRFNQALSDSNGTILNGSIPKSITDLNYHFNSKNNSIKLIPNSTVRDSNSKSIPGGTTSLTFDSSFDQKIKRGMIPHNVTSLEFLGSRGSKIESNSLPISIKTLVFDVHETSNNLKDIFLPNITSLTLNSCSDYQQLPKSIQTLSIYIPLDSTLINPFSGFKNLTSLDIQTQEHNLPDEIFPNSLTTLTLDCPNLQLTNNLLPKNLKTLLK
ncbi:hypothetical protein DDB_G0268254 [Dictyostelium discoideum AX4]|uniref:FNIP repeat-containing protein n=1 Tax=Dictyostelium discoideum TaxID=44689 RepID=Q55F52_DICDI|nr:hypothetical protein DDB_G0268254 [Dictyostelium discoideum AX4]EAL73580.1 hypothetical protein DDB_G0268254 [Dictyostelium discoideum AX4]|eukprot:XP_647681.1 hypothetical protein DDB_G0268254 [Dictyostelium discoideum AX4]